MRELLIAGQTNDEILQSLSYKLAPTFEYIQTLQGPLAIHQTHLRLPESSLKDRAGS